MAGLNRAYKRRGNAVALNGAPVLCLDAGSRISYPGTGTTWTDLSGNANNGTLVNGPTFDSANGGSIVFDGSGGDYVDCGTNSQLTSLSAFTVSFWLKSSSTNEQGLYGNTIYNNTIQSLSVGWHFEIYQSKLLMQIFPSSQYFQSSSTISTTTWYNAVFAYSAKVIQFYINGNLNSTSTFSTNFTPTSSVTVLGKLPYYNYPFIGNIANATHYNRALSATEVATNFELLRGRYGI